MIQPCHTFNRNVLHPLCFLYHQLYSNLDSRSKSDWWLSEPDRGSNPSPHHPTLHLTFLLRWDTFWIICFFGEVYISNQKRTQELQGDLVPILVPFNGRSSDVKTDCDLFYIGTTPTLYTLPPPNEIRVGITVCLPEWKNRLYFCNLRVISPVTNLSLPKVVRLLSDTGTAVYSVFLTLCEPGRTENLFGEIPPHSAQQSLCVSLGLCPGLRSK